MSTSASTNTSKRNTLTKAQRAAVFHDAGGFCHFCGATVDPLGSWSVVVAERPATVDHPPKKTEEKSALPGFLACTPCNDERGGRDIEAFREHLFEVVTTARGRVDRWEPLIPKGSRGHIVFAGEPGGSAEVPTP